MLLLHHHLLLLSMLSRVWFIPATLLLPKEVAKNVHFKIGVNGDLDNGLVGIAPGFQ